MTLRLEYETDEWSAEVRWGRDVTGIQEDEPETQITVTPKGWLTQEGAIALGQWLIEEIQGDES